MDPAVAAPCVPGFEASSISATASAIVAAAVVAAAAPPQTKGKKKGAGKGPMLTPKMAGVQATSMATPPAAVPPQKLECKGKGKCPRQEPKGGVIPKAALTPVPARAAESAGPCIGGVPAVKALPKDKGKGKGSPPPKCSLSEPPGSRPPVQDSAPAAPVDTSQPTPTPSGRGSSQGPPTRQDSGLDRLKAWILCERTAREALQGQLARLEERLAEVSTRQQRELGDVSHSLGLLERKFSQPLGEGPPATSPPPPARPPLKASSPSGPCASAHPSRLAAEGATVEEDRQKGFPFSLNFMQGRCTEWKASAFPLFWCSTSPACTLPGQELPREGEMVVEATPEDTKRFECQQKLDSLQDFVIKETEAWKERHNCLQELLSSGVMSERDSGLSGAGLQTQRTELVDKRLAAVERTLADLGERLVLGPLEDFSRQGQQFFDCTSLCMSEHDTSLPAPSRQRFDPVEERLGLLAAQKFAGLEQAVEEATKLQFALEARVQLVESRVPRSDPADIFAV